MTWNRNKSVGLYLKNGLLHYAAEGSEGYVLIMSLAKDPGAQMVPFIIGEKLMLCFLKLACVRVIFRSGSTDKYQTVV